MKIKIKNEDVLAQMRRDCRKMWRERPAVFADKSKYDRQRRKFCDRRELCL